MKKMLLMFRRESGFLVAIMVLLLVGVSGCATSDAARGNVDGEELPWNSPASWEDQMPMGAPY